MAKNRSDSLKSLDFSIHPHSRFVEVVPRAEVMTWQPLGIDFPYFIVDTSFAESVRVDEGLNCRIANAKPQPFSHAKVECHRSSVNIHPQNTLSYSLIVYNYYVVKLGGGGESERSTFQFCLPISRLHKVYIYSENNYLNVRHYHILYLHKCPRYVLA